MKKILYLFLIIITILFTALTAQAQENLSITDEEAHEIVLDGSIEDLKILLSSGYDINRPYYCSTLLTTALKSILRNGKPDIVFKKVQVLVQAGADINALPCSKQGMSALNWAVVLPSQFQRIPQNMLIGMEALIKEGKKQCTIPGIIDKPCKDITEADLTKIKEEVDKVFAIVNKNNIPEYLKIIDYLVQNGAKLNQTDFSSPLFAAMLNPQGTEIEIVQYLIEKGANINCLDDDGNTLLFFAKDNQVLIDLLIAAGVDESIRNKAGFLYTQVVETKTMVRRLNDDNSFSDEEIK